MVFTPTNSDEIRVTLTTSKDNGSRIIGNDLNPVPSACSYLKERYWVKSGAPTFRPGSSSSEETISWFHPLSNTTAFTTVDDGTNFKVVVGTADKPLLTICKATFASKDKDKAPMTLSLNGTKHKQSGRVKDIFGKSFASTARTFKLPNGNEYKWTTAMYDILTPEMGSFKLLRRGKNVIATTEKLDIDGRDGRRKDIDEFPLYVTDEGIEILDVVVATLALYERLLAN